MDAFSFSGEAEGTRARSLSHPLPYSQRLVQQQNQPEHCRQPRHKQGRALVGDAVGQEEAVCTARERVEGEREEREAGVVSSASISHIANLTVLVIQQPCES